MRRAELSGPLIPAAVLIVLGVLFLLDNLDVLDFGQVIGDWWPAAIIALGLWWLLSGATILGIIAVVVGAIFLADQLDLAPGIGSLWPLILIALGLWILAQWRRCATPPKPGCSSTTRLLRSRFARIA